ncbi:peptidyl-prolyl cis-trans isomerase-like isoform X2 [Prosopis cineraria]|uniref:peptidyl-prolyl cis-trans isomerase-like isoform X2 n=1 Tax=Prosopis cineraria TaxID=364024 RepID=UPI002410B3D0|nr:peptidyl-prolyl cis-trans isomerase-like isoform X2 [Prosopis cineraria]
MVFELFKDDAPASVENFCALCTGEKGTREQGCIRFPLHYKDSTSYHFGKGGSYVKGVISAIHTPYMDKVFMVQIPK